MSSLSESTCPHCVGSSRVFSSRGLKTHITRIHKDIPRTTVPRPTSGATVRVNSSPPTPNSQTVGCTLDQLASLKKSVRVLRHIPKGARSMAASKLCSIINNCVAINGLDEWCALLSFSYRALRTPETASAGSLTAKVKANIDAFSYLSPDDCTATARSLSLTKLIESKVYEGDLRGAVRLLMSEDTVAPSSPDTLAALQSKHPSPSRPLHFPMEPDQNCPTLSVKVEDVTMAVSSFHSGSAAGLDGIRPDLLKELTSSAAGDSGVRLMEALTKLCNFLLSGKLHPEVCPYLYGATLCALRKKEGGVRPIAVGSTFRRLVAKLGCRAVRQEMASYLQPTQLGFGTRLGCEAAIHALRTFVMDPQNRGNVVVKLDLKNAFNCVERDTLLSEVKEIVPTLYPFLYQVYHLPSNLFYDTNPIMSQVGAQQGDPLGPLTFSLSIQKVIAELKSPLNIWYLDDGTIGGKPEEVEQDIFMLLPRLRDLGLEVNTAKCEFFSCEPGSNSILPSFSSLLPGLRELNFNSLSLLGAPIFPSAVPEALLRRKELLLLAGDRLKDLNPHVALALLQKCFAVPKVTYLLRTAPVWLFPDDISLFDTALKSTLELVVNVSLNDVQWTQAALPVRHGGLGVRRVQDVSLPAFLASAHGVADLVAKILHVNGDRASIPYMADALNAWSALNPGTSVPENPRVQRTWDDTGSKATVEGLIANAVGVDRARLLAASRSESGAWLHALPSPQLGTLLDGNSLRVAVALRLGCTVCQPHTCICGVIVGANGHHALSCRRCTGRHPRHHALNDTIQRALRSAGVPSMLEPPGLNRTDGKRPDGLTLLPWERGRCLVWDATCVSTFAASHISRTSRTAGAAAETQAALKRQKYAPLGSGYIFVPFAVETAGCWGADAKRFIRELGRRFRQKGEDPRSESFLVQRLSIIIQRGNAASVMGTFVPGAAGSEMFV